MQVLEVPEVKVRESGCDGGRINKPEGPGILEQSTLGLGAAVLIAEAKGSWIR